jgi:hypothetical protein
MPLGVMCSRVHTKSDGGRSGSMVEMCFISHIEEEVSMSQLARLRYPFLALVTFLTIMSLPAGVSAKPAFHDHFSEVILDADICGVVGTLNVTVNQVITFTDTSVKVTGQVTQVFTAPDGRTAVLMNAGQYTNTFTDNGDGTFTFVDTYKGTPEKISSGGNGGVVVRDAGIISFITTVNENTGDVTTEIVQHGPHPEADSDFTIFCDAFLAALG